MSTGAAEAGGEAGAVAGTAGARAPRRGGARVRWTDRMREAFLDELALHCHVGRAAGAIGVPVISVYHQRRHNPDFAAAWETSVALGYQMLETRLIGQALGGQGATIPGEDGAPEVNVDLAMKLLAMHRPTRQGARGPKVRIARPEETDALLLAKLAQIEARRAPREAAA